MPARTPKTTVKVRRSGPKVGDEVLLRARVRKVRDPAYGDDLELVLDIDGVLVGAPVRVRESKIVKQE